MDSRESDKPLISRYKAPDEASPITRSNEYEEPGRNADSYLGLSSKYYQNKKSDQVLKQTYKINKIHNKLPKHNLKI